MNRIWGSEDSLTGHESPNRRIIMGLYIFKGREILVNSSGEASALITDNVFILDRYTDRLTGAEGIEVSDKWQTPQGCIFIQLREYFASHPEDDCAAAARMKGLLNWRKDTAFCSACGAALKEHPSENARICPDCRKVHYPRIEPCVIAVIKKDEQILLLRHRQRNQDIYACLAGFVEVGETLEQALKREVREETGLEIKNIQYAGSQSWPFPDQLMIAFYADYESGELKLQEDEISDAGWFRRDCLPNCPRPGSISWRLIHFDF